jgi:hypothetical protein
MGFAHNYADGMTATVQCPHCDELSQVPITVMGEYVRCPSCEHPFRAAAADERTLDVPTLRPSSRQRNSSPSHVDSDPELLDDEFADAPSNGRGSGFLIGLGLLPLSVPFVWLLGPMLTGKETIFSYGLPIAIGLAATGLALGVVQAADWSYRTRVKGILAILFVSYFCAGFLYFMKEEWMEEFRKRPFAPQQWKKFTPPGRLFSIDMPQKPEVQPMPIIGTWDLTAYRAVSSGRQNDSYVLAYGRPPNDAIELANDAFYERVKSGVAEAVRGEVTTEKFASNSNRDGREYAVAMPDRTRRILQVYRLGEQVVVVAVEGAFLPKDAPDVTKFFNSLALVPKKR